MSMSLDTADWTRLAELARRADSDDLADRVLVYQASDPLVLTMRDVVSEIKGMREETREGFDQLSKEIHELRSSIEDTSTPVPSDGTSAVNQFIGVVKDNPRNAAIVLLLALSIFVGGPQTVSRLLDYAIGLAPKEQVEVEVRPPVLTQERRE